MVSIRDASVMHIVSSVAGDIADSEAAKPTGVRATRVDSSIASSLGTAFDGLISSQMKDRRPAADSGIAALEPFSFPPLSGDGLTDSLREALGSFQKLSGGKQLTAFSNQQRVAEIGNAQRGSLSDAQRVSEIGSAQFGAVSDAQRVSELGNAQRGSLSDAQRVSEIGSDQFGALNQPHRVGELHVASEALKMLDHCHDLFALLSQIVAGDQEIAKKANQFLR